jgi:hypothetical protein
MITPDQFLGACLWEIERQHLQAADRFGGRRAPRSAELSRLRRSYLQSYAAIAERHPRA